MKIFVNGKETSWKNKTLTYHNVLDIALGPHKKTEAYAIRFQNGSSPENGSLRPGHYFYPKPGTLVFVDHREPSTLL